MDFLKKFAWQVELFFFARLRTLPVEFKGGMCNVQPYFCFGMMKPTLFCMSYFKQNPNKRNDTVDVKHHSDVKHCSDVEHRFIFAKPWQTRSTGEHCSHVGHSFLMSTCACELVF